MAKIALVGAGHLGKIHANCIQAVDELEFRGVFDIDTNRMTEVAENHGVRTYGSLDDLLADTEVVDIVTPTGTHFAIAKKALEAGKHVFIEKPVTQTVEEAEELLGLQQKAGVKVAVGHVERYNPAYLALEGIDLEPGFIEGHRLAEFNPRGTDVSVVLDLMIHDLDIILKLVDAEVTDVRSKRVSVLSSSDDICNSRIEFSNGCVVNLTASRMSMKNMRKLRIFQPDAYISIDFLERESQIIRMFDTEEEGDDVLMTARGPKRIQIDTPRPPGVNAIQMELKEFARCIAEGGKPKVDLQDGLNALRLAYRILEAG